jgi:hypothetical protein
MIMYKHSRHRTSREKQPVKLLTPKEEIKRAKLIRRIFVQRKQGKPTRITRPVIINLMIRLPPICSAILHFSKDFIFYVVNFLTSLSTLLNLIARHQKRLKYITLSDFLKHCFPDEVVAEVTAFHIRLIDRRESVLSIRTKLLWQFLSLIWAFYFQIKIDNLRSRFNHQRNDK